MFAAQLIELVWVLEQAVLHMQEGEGCYNIYEN